MCRLQDNPGPITSQAKQWSPREPHSQRNESSLFLDDSAQPYTGGQSWCQKGKHVHAIVKSLPARPRKFSTTEIPEREISIHLYHLPPSIFANNVIRGTAEGTRQACLFRNHSHATEIRLKNQHSRVQVQS